MPPTTQPSKVTIGLVQMKCTRAQPPNIDKAVARIGEAAAAGAQIVCLQELFAGHYPCQAEDHAWFAEAEPIPGPASEAIAAAAKRHGVVVIGSFFERRAPGLYHNTAVVFDADGSTVGMYRKMHIPDDPHYYEKFYFAPGDLGFGAVNTRFGRLGVLVCWDQWYPEAARITALHGAQIIFYPTAIGWQAPEKQQYGASQHDAWETSMRAHAIANGLFVAAVNRVGTEEHLEFWGGSFVADPNGTLLAKGTHEHEETLIVECNLDQIDVVRTHWPFLRDRRIDAYGDITKRWIGE
jgi:N-carbamoylputrescine amidase